MVANPTWQSQSVGITLTIFPTGALTSLAKPQKFPGFKISKIPTSISVQGRWRWRWIEFCCFVLTEIESWHLKDLSNHSFMNQHSKEPFILKLAAVCNAKCSSTFVVVFPLKRLKKVYRKIVLLLKWTGWYPVECIPLPWPIKPNPLSNKTNLIWIWIMKNEIQWPFSHYQGKWKKKYGQ